MKKMVLFGCLAVLVLLSLAGILLKQRHNLKDTNESPSATKIDSIAHLTVGITANPNIWPTLPHFSPREIIVVNGSEFFVLGFSAIRRGVVDEENNTLLVNKTYSSEDLQKIDIFQLLFHDNYIFSMGYERLPTTDGFPRFKKNGNILVLNGTTPANTSTWKRSSQTINFFTPNSSSAITGKFDGLIDTGQHFLSKTSPNRA